MSEKNDVFIPKIDPALLGTTIINTAGMDSTEMASAIARQRNLETVKEKQQIDAALALLGLEANATKADLELRYSVMQMQRVGTIELRKRGFSSAQLENAREIVQREDDAYNFLKGKLN